VEELASGLDEDEISGPKTPKVEKTLDEATKGKTSALADGGADIGRRRKDL
jgi:hypothetical protein